MTNLLRPIFLFIALASLLPLSGQQKHTLSGYVRDKATGEDLIGARISVLETGSGVLTNEYGFYSLTLPAGSYTVVYKYISYADDTVKVNLDRDISMNRQLAEASVQMETVEISEKAADQNVKGLEMSTQTINVEFVKKLPALMGEVDVIRTIQLLPGVQAVGEGITGYYVRGGQSNQNLILLDEATVYNASHVLGFFSVFNSDALKDEYKLYKGGIPARYGGRLSSVLDLRMREGNDKEFHGSGGIGLISSRLSLEGPLVKDRSSFMVSGRRTYGDLALKFSKDDDLKNSQAYFYDLNTKVNYKFSDKDRIFLSGYFGRDVFKFRDLFLNEWGNGTGTLRWNHLFSDKLFANTTAVVSDFTYGFEAEVFSGSKFSYNAGIRDYSLMSNFDWFASPKNQVTFGIAGTVHQFTPGVFTPVDNGDSTDNFLQPLVVPDEYAAEFGLYLNNEQEVSKRLSLLYGLRYSFFAQVGPGTEYAYANDGETVVDSTNYNTAQIIKPYHGLEPRFAARYTLDEHSSFKLSYNRMFQYLHLASNSTASFPWDIWIPSGEHVKPQIADQVAVGYFRNLLDNTFETSVEVYYKYMQNQIDFKNGAQLILNPRIETEILAGEGWSYGTEFFVKKKTGRLTGWVGYTLAYSRRQIIGINNDKPYAAGNDRRHDISVVGSYSITKRTTFSASWVFATGNAVTFPTGKYQQNGFWLPYYEERNNARMPAYHRMDISIYIDPKPYEGTKKRHLESGWNFSVYNAYGRRNPWSISFQEDEDNPGTTQAVKLFLFRWVPSITWNFKF